MTYTPVYGPCCRLVIVKAFPYRATPLEEFSNDYTFSPINTPTNDTQWESFVTALLNQEATIYPTNVKFHRAYGYDTNDPHAHHVFVHDWQALGENYAGLYLPAAGDIKGAGDQASCVQWRHSVLSAKGKPVYFRKFHHEPWMGPTGGDNLATDYLAKLQTYADFIRTYLGGPYSTKYPTGTAQTSQVIPYVTTRTLKRRGKRPNPPT